MFGSTSDLASILGSSLRNYDKIESAKELIEVPLAQEKANVGLSDLGLASYVVRSLNLSIKCENVPLSLGYFTITMLSKSRSLGIMVALSQLLNAF